MIKRFAVSLAICIALHSGASAQSTKSALQTLTTHSFPTKSNGAVTPAIMSTWAASDLSGSGPSLGTGQVDLLLESTNIYWRTNAVTAFTLSALGWEDSVNAN